MIRREVVVTGIGMTWGQSVTCEAGMQNYEDPGTLTGPEAALDEAVADAGITRGSVCEAPLVIGSSKGGIARIGDPSLNGGFWREVPPGATAVEVVRRAGLVGPVRIVNAACASGALAVMLAAQSVAYGETDVVIAGGIEEPLSPLLLAGYAKLGVLAEDGACRPFDRRRHGFVPAAGAGFLVLEAAERAAARGARVNATLAGWAAGTDTSHAVAFDDGGDAVCRVTRAALARAGVGPDELGYINAHGTGTRRNDAMEAAGLRAVLGRACEGIPVSSTKGWTGHLLGAAGAVEFGLTVRALVDGRLPQTAGLEDPDPDCRLNLIYGAPRPLDPSRRAAMSLSFGFGGAVVALVAKRRVDG